MRLPPSPPHIPLLPFPPFRLFRPLLINREVHFLNPDDDLVKWPGHALPPGHNLAAN